MDITTISTAAVLLLILAGVFIGLFFALRGGQNNRPPQKPKGGPADLVEIARLERDKETNMLLVVVEGKLYANASSLSGAQRQKVAAAANDLQKWLGLAPVASTPAPVAYSPSASTPPAGILPGIDGVASPVQPVTTNPLVSLQRSIGTSKPASTFKSIPAQIDEILQGRLEGTPFEEVGVHLIESPTQGVIVQVGIEQYPGVEAVPDEEVRKLIRSAVAEWEKRNR